VIYTARRPDAVFVLHAFQKKTQRTSQRDIEVAKARFGEMTKDRK
jgi:phage-related protein